MPTALTPHLVDSSLAALSDWTGDTSAIRRTIRLDTQQQVVDLIGAVQVSSGSLQHEPTVERDGTAVTFTLSTEELGGVSEIDIALAAHIDNLAGRLVGAPPTPGPTSASASDDESARLAEGAGRNHMPDLVVDHDGQPASRGAAKGRRGRGRAGDTIGVPTNTGGGAVTPGLAVPDDDPGHPKPGPEPEQRPSRRR
ncbi:MAG TPA: 4a-hydroxytetrahydrobiopterin dehydratase [Mycobacteriales bacterium]|nr:4a-hydroxytetrahydrobiopterin dehydratase [Mycobacteriales bacterium]